MKDDFDHMNTNWFPICIKYNQEYHFYVHIGRAPGGRWYAQALGDCSSNDGFRVDIDAVDSAGETMFTYSGPVNPFDISLKIGDEDSLLCLTFPNSAAKKLAKTEEDWSGTFMEFHVKISNCNEDIEAAAKAQVEQIDAELKLEAKRRKEGNSPAKAKSPRRLKNKTQPHIKRECFICDIVLRNSTLLKNHIVDRHYKDELMEMLPQKYPADCPKCGKKKVRDKYTMMRHFALTDRVIYDVFELTEDQLRGEPVYDGLGEPDPKRIKREDKATAGNDQQDIPDDRSAQDEEADEV